MAQLVDYFVSEVVQSWVINSYSEKEIGVWDKARNNPCVHPIQVEALPVSHGETATTQT